MKLAEEDQPLTTFITPYDRFKSCRGPIGFAATGDSCLRRDITLQGVSSCVKVVDDLLLYDDDYLAHLQRVDIVLSTYLEDGMALNTDKFVLAAKAASFCGYILSQIVQQRTLIK